MIKLLIVDDSAFMRKLLSDLFSAEPDFCVLDTARNGKDAVEKVKRLKPDVITMDVEMPTMDGIRALEYIMGETPTPVVMVSSLTRAGTEATIRALELGAVDFVAKTAGPISTVTGISAELLAKCRAAAKANVGQIKKIPPKLTGPLTYQEIKPASTTGEEKVVAIGTSTGGPKALQEVISRLPGNLPCGVVIVQHMPAGFTKSLSERLNSLSALSVKEAEHNDIIKPGHVYIAPGDYHMLIDREGGRKAIKLNQKPPVGGHRPAVDPMFESVVRVYGSKTVGVILTGMGHDGTYGFELMKQHNAYTIAEDQSTAVVYGMPKSVVEKGLVDKVAPLSSIAFEIVKAVNK